MFINTQAARVEFEAAAGLQVRLFYENHLLILFYFTLSTATTPTTAAARGAYLHQLEEGQELLHHYSGVG